MLQKFPGTAKYMKGVVEDTVTGIHRSVSLRVCVRVRVCVKLKVLRLTGVFGGLEKLVQFPPHELPASFVFFL